jgi:hypothetical protein
MLVVAENSSIPLILNFSNDKQEKRSDGLAVSYGAVRHHATPVVD